MNCEKMFIDFKKFERFFAFGCSLTSHVYPTYADVLSSEMPNAKFYNFGRSGAGNLLISSRIAEANNKFKFNSTDLVIVMFTTFYREDRYMNGTWVPRGNVYNSCLYGADFVKQFADPMGYIIRDYALIELSITYLKSLPCKSIFLTVSDVNEDLDIGKTIYNLNQYNYNDMLHAVSKTYENLIKFFPKPLKSFVVGNCKSWPVGHSFIVNNKLINDPHPNPEIHYNYLKHLGFNLTEKSSIYVKQSMEKLKEFKNKDDFEKVFPILNENQNETGRLLF